MFNEMKQFLSFVIKEAKHILRDKRTMLILFGMPIVLMLLFGFAITNDVKNLRGFSVHGISQASILEWVAISFSNA